MPHLFNFQMRNCDRKANVLVQPDAIGGYCWEVAVQGRAYSSPAPGRVRTFMQAYDRARQHAHRLLLAYRDGSAAKSPADNPFAEVDHVRPGRHDEWLRGLTEAGHDAR